jgi:hypothetical protein
MSRWNAIFCRLALVLSGAACLGMPAVSVAQMPWAVTLTPTLDPLPVGLCSAIHLTVLDSSGKDAPRNALGARVTIADFDITVTGNGVVANRIDAFHWESCACQSAKPASTATVTASYPSRSLAANARIPGVTLQRAATFTIAAAKGGTNPRACTEGVAVAAPPAAGTLLQPVPPAVARTSPPPAPPAGTLPQPVPPAVARTPPVSSPPAAPAPIGVALPPTAPPVALAPTPVNPSGFTAVQIAPGQVRLSWNAVGSASFYGLFGPGLTAGGEKIGGATTFIATNVPAGSQQWAVGSFIDPGNISTPASAFPRVTLNVTAPSPPPTTPPAPPVTTGRYRVVATRFTVELGSLDNVLDLDGKGDEIYGGFSMFHVNRINGQILDQDLRRTKVHGQVIEGTDRVAAGSATANGGLVGGDSYPSTQSAPASDQAFPFRVWDGTLTNKQDALVLLPTLWESDNDDSNFEDWFLSEKAALPVFWWDATLQSALTGLEFEVVTTNTFATGFGFAGLLPATSKDHPIGLTLRPTGFELQRRAIVLTREILEAALTPSTTTGSGSTASELDKFNDTLKESRDATSGHTSSAGETGLNQPQQILIGGQSEQQSEMPSGQRAGGTIAIPLVDGAAPNLNGKYTLYLRVERLP